MTHEQAEAIVEALQGLHYYVGCIGWGLVLLIVVCLIKVVYDCCIKED